jgi:hypothetical protein
MGEHRSRFNAMRAAIAAIVVGPACHRTVNVSGSACWCVAWMIYRGNAAFVCGVCLAE